MGYHIGWLLTDKPTHQLDHRLRGLVAARPKLLGYIPIGSLAKQHTRKTEISFTPSPFTPYPSQTLSFKKR